MQKALKSRKIINYLELGVAAGTRAKKLAQHAKEKGRMRRIVGIDIDTKVRAKSDLPILEIRKGKRKGEALNVLAEYLHKGIKVRVVNAEFLFSDLRVPKGDRWDFVAEEQQQDLKSAILTLLNRVMSKNGRLYITDFVDNMRGVKEKLTGAGFVVDKEEMVTKEKAKVWWAKEGFRRAKKDGDQGWLPIRLVARKIKEVPTEKKPT